MYSKRQETIKSILIQKQIDAFLFTNFYNICYFTGFRTLVAHEREAFLLVTKEDLYVLSDGRYVDIFKPQEHVLFKLLSTEKGLIKHLQEIILGEKIAKLGFEKEDMKWSEYTMFQNTLGVELIPQDRVGLKMRAIKEDKEIHEIQKACEAGDDCLSDISKLLRVGMNEKEIAWNIERWIREKGYDVAFDPIVAVDINSSIPHYDTKHGSGVIKDNSIILIDMGVMYEGYNSDISRMFFMGKQSYDVIKAYEELRIAQEKTIKQISSLQRPIHIDSYCRKQLIEKGFPSYVHSTGHGVGLEVHEYPKISLTSDDDLKPGNVFTVEPGIYYSGKWGMRIEDTVVMSENNEVKILTSYPKKMCLL